MRSLSPVRKEKEHLNPINKEILCIIFFTTESTAPPVIPLLWYGVMVLLIVMAVWASLRYYQNEQFRKIFRNLQIFQLICLYIWYFAFQLPWSNSLPLYHCRLAMFAVLLLPDRWKSKQFFCLDGSQWGDLCLGLSGL